MEGPARILRALVGFACTTLLLVVALPAAGGAWQHDAGGTARTTQPAAPFALERRLARVQTTLDGLLAREQALARERSNLTLQLAAVRRAQVVAQRRLASRLTALYKQGDAGPLGALVDAGSLDDALARLDRLERAARQDAAVLERARALRRELESLVRAITARHIQAARLRASTGTAAAVLAQMRAAQASMAPQRVSVPVEPAVSISNTSAPAAQLTVPPADGARTLTVVATAYALRGMTAVGSPVGHGVVAVDPAVIPLGSRLTVPGYGSAVAADTGPAVRGARIDVWFPSVRQAHAWGKRTVTVTVHGG